MIKLKCVTLYKLLIIWVTMIGLIACASSVEETAAAAELNPFSCYGWW